MPEINNSDELNKIEGIGSPEAIKARVEELKKMAQEKFNKAKRDKNIFITSGIIATGLELAATQNHNIGFTVIGALLGIVSVASGSAAGREFAEAARNEAEATMTAISHVISGATDKGKN
jgi:hypothetical protein